MPHLSSVVTAGLLLGLGLACGACGTATQEDARLRPEGSLLAGDAAAAARILDRLMRFEGTALGRRAGELRARIDGCSRGVVAEAPAGDRDALVEAIRCGELAPEALGSGRSIRPGELIFFLRPDEDRWIEGVARTDGDGSLAIEARVDGSQGGLRGAAQALLWPSAEPPGPPRLSGGEALVHARMRPAGGIDLASLVPEGGQGDRLFRLKSELFSGAVLDGVWELVVYLPPQGRRMPPMALGLDVKSRALAVKAMERFVEDIAGTWSLRRVPFAVGDARGACFPRLNLLPELAPCYVATDEQIVVGWDPESVERALLGDPGESLGTLGRDGGLLLRMDRFDEADERLRRARDPESPPARIAYPWRRLFARAASTADGVRLEVEMPADGMPARASADVPRDLTSRDGS